MKSFTPLLLVINIILIGAVGFLFVERSENVDVPPQQQVQEFVVVDFKALSQRLMVSMSERVTSQDLQLNPAMIELMAQSEAAKLVRTVSMHRPDAIVLNKQSIVHTPDAIDITNDIAQKMGLPEVTKADLEAFITGVPPQKSRPVGVK